MRHLFLLLAISPLAACVEKNGPDPYPTDEFVGRWTTERTLTASNDCPASPSSSPTIIITGNWDDGYLGSGEGQPGEQIQFVLGDDGEFHTDVRVGEYWPGWSERPDVAPGVMFRLHEQDSQTLVGTATTSFPILGPSGPEYQCEFEWSVIATRAAAPI